jgi:hypothetical protein
MRTVQLPPGGNPIAVNKYIKYQYQYAFIALTGTSLTVPLSLCINRVRICSANLEYKDADPLELVSSSGGHILYHFTFTVVRFQRTSSFVTNVTSRGLWI